MSELLLCGQGVRAILLSAQAKIIRHEEAWAGLYAWLQLAPMSEAQLLQQVLLPNFDSLPQKAVLDRILATGAWRHDEALRNALADISFVGRGKAAAGPHVHVLVCPRKPKCLRRQAYPTSRTTFLKV